MSDYDKEREICEAADGWEWEVRKWDGDEWPEKRLSLSDGRQALAINPRYATIDEALPTFEFIAHFNPQRVMELLNQQIALQQENEQLTDIVSQCRNAAGFGTDKDPMSSEGWDALGMTDAVPAFIQSQFDRVNGENEELRAQLQEKSCCMCNYIERKTCQGEKAELRAHVERLMMSIDHLCLTCQHEGKPCDRTERGFTTSCCSDYKRITPSQSLQAIKAEVEEEVIERSAKEIDWLEQHHWDTLPRKYRG